MIEIACCEMMSNVFIMRQGWAVMLLLLIVVLGPLPLARAFKTNIPARFRPRGGQLEVLPYALGIVRVKLSYPIPKFAVEEIILARALHRELNVSVEELEYRLVHSHYGRSGIEGSVESVGLTINRHSLESKIWISGDERHNTAKFAFQRGGEGDDDGVLAGSILFTQAEAVYTSHTNTEIQCEATNNGVDHALHGAPFFMAVGRKYSMGIFLPNAAHGSSFELIRSSENAVQLSWRFDGGGDYDLFILPGPHPEDVHRQYLHLVGKPSLPPMSAFGVHLFEEGDVPLSSSSPSPVPKDWPAEGKVPSARVYAAVHTRAVLIERLREGDNAVAAAPASVITNQHGGEYILDDAKKMIPFADVANKKGRRAISSSIQRRSDSGVATASVIFVADAAVNEPLTYSRYDAKSSSAQNENDHNAAAILRAKLEQDREVSHAKKFIHTTSKGGRISRHHIARALGLWTSMAISEVGNKTERRSVFVAVPFSGVHRYGGAFVRFTSPKDGSGEMWDDEDVPTHDDQLRRARLYMRSALANLSSTLLSHALSGMSMTAVTIATRDVCAIGSNRLLNPVTLETRKASDENLHLFEPFVRYVQQQALSPITTIPLCSSVFQSPFAMDGNQPFVSGIKKSLSLRMQLLPYIYTEAFHAHYFGVALVRPLFFEYGYFAFWLTKHHSYLLGPGLIVRPIVEEKPLRALMSIPSPDRWFSYWTGRLFPSNILETMCDAGLDDVLVAVKGGTIVPQAMGTPLTTKQVREQGKIALLVAVDVMEHAVGSLFLDDGATDSFEANGAYMYYQFVFDRGCLTMESMHPNNSTRFSRHATTQNQIEGKTTELPMPRVFDDNPLASTTIESITFFGLGGFASKVRKATVEKRVDVGADDQQWVALRGRGGRSSGRREVPPHVSSEFEVLSFRGQLIDALDGTAYRLCFTFGGAGE